MTVHDDAESGTELLQWHLDAAKAEISSLRARAEKAEAQATRFFWCLLDDFPPMTTVDEDGKVWRVEQCGRWVYSAEEDAVCWESWGHGDDRQVYVLTPIKDAPMKDGATCTGLSAEVDFEDETHYLREWVNGGGVPSDRLREELAKWLVRMSNSPSRAINTLALAMADEERNATIEDGAT